MKNTTFDGLMLDPEFRKVYAVESLLADCAQLVADLLVSRKMKKADLARKLGKTPAFVSQLLNGKANMTVKTLAEVVHALDGVVKVKAEDLAAGEPEVADSADGLHLRLKYHSALHGSIQFENSKVDVPRSETSANADPLKPGLAA